LKQRISRQIFHWLVLIPGSNITRDTSLEEEWMSIGGRITVMSWKVINKILGLAATDPGFFQALQQQPLTSIQAQGFILAPDEQAVFEKIDATDLSEFSQRVLDALASGDQETRFL
jgi:hypothetical protein